MRSLDDLPAKPAGLDYYDESPSEPESVRNSRVIARMLAIYLGAEHEMIATPSGEIRCSWHRGEKSLELEFSPDGRIRHLRRVRGSTVDDGVMAPVDGTVRPSEESLDRIYAMTKWLSSRE